jgi:hypothetical protein
VLREIRVGEGRRETRGRSGVGERRRARDSGGGRLDEDGNHEKSGEEMLKAGILVYTVDLCYRIAEASNISFKQKGTGKKQRI